MRAVLINSCGGPEVLEVRPGVARPARGPGQVLIRARSAGVNPVDLLVRSGGVYKPEAFPKILGGDVAGVVEEADAASAFKRGDAVMALTPGFFGKTQAGCYAEFVAADEAWLARVPTEQLPLERAAGLPLVALTAWQALRQAAPVAGERVVITAAAGGVGHVAVQLAKALGLHVIAIAGPSNQDFVRSLGADEVLDYTKQDVAEALSGSPADIAVDCMGTRSELLPKLLSVTRRHLSHILNAGTDQALLAAAGAAAAAGRGGPSVSQVFVQPDGKQLQEIADLVAAGKVRLEVALSLPLERAAEAHAQVATGHTRGKVVLTL